MKTSDFINIATYTTGKEEQRISPASIHRTNAIMRANNNIEQVYMQMAYRANRSERV